MIQDSDTLLKWNHEDLEKNYRILGSLDDVDEKELDCFIFIPYYQFRLATNDLNQFKETSGLKVITYLGRVDTTDIRYVVLGFYNKEDREKFLVSNTITKRNKPV